MVCFRTSLLSGSHLLRGRGWWEAQTQNVNDFLQFKHPGSHEMWEFAHILCFPSCSFWINCGCYYLRQTPSLPLDLLPFSLLSPMSSFPAPLLAESFTSAYKYEYAYIWIRYNSTHLLNKSPLTLLPSSFSLRPMSITPQLHPDCSLLRSPVLSIVVKPTGHHWTFISLDCPARISSSLLPPWNTFLFGFHDTIFSWLFFRVSFARFSSTLPINVGGA